MAAKMVLVGECFGMDDAMLIQSALSAHNIEVFIPGLSSGTAAYTSGFASKILVDTEFAEEAKALIAELRSGASQVGQHDDDEDDDEDGDDDEAQRAGASGHDTETAVQRRRWLMVTVVVALALPLGAGHAVNRAWGRALLLLGGHVLALRYASAGPRWALGGSVALVLLDLVGALALVRKRFATPARAPLPTASARRVS
jgi:hypothetical protein